MRSFISIVIGSLILAISSASGNHETVVEFSCYSGGQLIEKLLDLKTRSNAFYELWRRANPKEDSGYVAFTEDHCDLQVIVCPQGQDVPPVYLVLYDYLSGSSELMDDEYELKNASELFPPLDTFVQQPYGMAIDAFLANGKSIEPFGRRFSSPDIIANINGDGFVECADRVSCYMEESGGVMEALLVSVVKTNAQPILAVLYNWGNEEWDYRFTDLDKDGIPEIAFGPKNMEGIKSEVVYRWVQSENRYVGPKSGVGDHFQVLVADNISSEFKRLEKQKSTFPQDPAFIDENDMENGQWSRRGKRKPSPKEVSKPYRYASLRTLFDEELLRYMGEGKGMWNLEWDSIIKTHAPTNFWEMDTKAAALSTVDANRYPSHRKHYRLAIDDRDGQSPPDVCSVSFSYTSAHMNVCCNFFLCADPQKSYLASASSYEDDFLSSRFLHNRPIYDFRYCELAYEEAMHVAHAIWWLNRVRSRETRSLFSMGIRRWSSTADGDGAVLMKDGNGNELINYSGTIWAGHASERWTDYNKETFLNFGEFLIASALPEHLSERWDRFDLKHSRNGEDNPQYTFDELIRLEDFSGQFLSLFSTNQTRISYGIVAQAARASGDLAFVDLSEELLNVLNELPAPTIKRTYEEVSAEIDGIDALIDDGEAGTELHEKRSELDRELMDILYDAGMNSIDGLRVALVAARKKAGVANAPEDLQKWVASNGEDPEWALYRLKEVDQKQYLASLEWCLKNFAGDSAHQVFEEIARIDPQYAEELAREMPPGKEEGLAVSAFADLIKINGIPDEKKRVEALIQIALDPGNGWEERGQAIELLVPRDNPLRYPSKDVDQAMLKLFDPKLADDTINFTLREACDALARRSRTEYFGEMEECLKTIEDGMVYHDVLGALTQLGQAEPSKYKPRLLALLKPELTKTNRWMDEILWAIWAADLGELKPALETMATSSPDDYQDEKASRFGGGVTPVEGRFHFARQIVGIWNEEDPITRAKLLLAFGFKNARDFVGEQEPGRRFRMQRELDEIREEFVDEQMEEVEDFINYCEVKSASKDQGPSRHCGSFATFAKDELGISDNGEHD